MYSGIVTIGIKTIVKTEAPLPNPIFLRSIKNHRTPDTKATNPANAIGMPKKNPKDRLTIKNKPKPIPIGIPINSLLYLDARSSKPHQIHIGFASQQNHINSK